MARLPKAKKSYGQNFLADRGVLKKIIAAAELEPGEMVLEIGPGTGILTEALLNAGANVVAVEADPELAALMRKNFGNRITLVEGDVMNLSRDPSPPTSAKLWRVRMTDGGFKIVANIPYNITSALLEKFLTNDPRPSRMVLMVQREVADRITAKPGEMSVLAVMCQLYASCKKIANVSAGAFRPTPKVDSAILRLDVRPLPLFKGELEGVTVDPETIIALAKAGFASRRKQLHGNLARAGFGKSEKIKETLADLGLRPDIRAEDLSLDDWVRLYRHMSP